MSYTTSSDLKGYLGMGVDDVADNALLTALIARAQKWIDSYTGRTFEAAADTVHYFTVGLDTAGADLYFDADCCQITSVTNNADNGSNGTAVTTSQYVTLPRNSTPYHGVRLLTSSGVYWRYTHDAEKGIAVTGRWAYSVTAPADIVQACLRLAAYLYRQKDAQVFDVTAQPEMGTLTIPKGMPADVKQILNDYRRAAL